MKRTLYSGVGLLLVGLLFLAFNLLSSLLLRDQQFDLTQQKLYTFSAGTRKSSTVSTNRSTSTCSFRKAAPVTCPPCATTPAASRKCWTSMHGGAMAMSDCS